VVAVAAFTVAAPSAFAFETVTIFGKKRELDELQYTMLLDAVQRYSDARMTANLVEMNQALAEIYEIAGLDPKTRPDVCNVLATETTRQTTSTMPSEARFIAAQQVFTAISALNGGTGARDAIGGSPPVMRNGRLTPTFTFTFADGGKETFWVGSLVPPSLIRLDSVPGSLTQGTGNVQSCNPG
jgi:hypothetical protein